MSDQSIPALVITFHSAVGQQHLPALEREFGPCAADCGAGPVWAEHRAPTTASRVFAAPPALADLLGSGSVELAIDVTARIESRAPSSVTYQGSGAAFHAILQSNPDMRRQAFVELPGPWVSAIARAARGERLLGPSPEVAAAAVAVARASAAVPSAPKPVAPVSGQSGRTIRTKQGTMTMVPGRGWVSDR